MRRWKPEAKRVGLELIRKNIPFRYIVAGDAWLDKTLTSGDMDGLSAVIITKPTFLDEGQKTVLAGVEAHSVNWPDEKRLFELLPRQIRVEGTTQVYAERALIFEFHMAVGAVPRFGQQLSNRAIHCSANGVACFCHPLSVHPD
ncbi:hypothetical protein ACFSSA_14315 [Luteolibacter algae]|uniref:Uncharacterized protein n=1 Tax=Luteolibacter algae TaxID=454151 RepID=A0ABW5DBI4_9BACT